MKFLRKRRMTFGGLMELANFVDDGDGDDSFEIGVMWAKRQKREVGEPDAVSPLVR